jgi:protein tyrosine phosphatase (PTP) superfamily phosphohydrolase (DUF442 family)
MRWVIPSRLARSSRPGYDGEDGAPVSREVADRWIRAVKEEGVRSIICLLAEDQLTLYEGLPGGLVGYYRSAGLEVRWIPVRDHLVPPIPDSQIERSWQAYRELPKPVLVHCSAGVDRTGRVVEYIQSRLEGGDAA